MKIISPDRSFTRRLICNTHAFFPKPKHQTQLSWDVNHWNENLCICVSVFILTQVVAGLQPGVGPRIATTTQVRCSYTCLPVVIGTKACEHMYMLGHPHTGRRWPTTRGRTMDRNNHPGEMQSYKFECSSVDRYCILWYTSRCWPTTRGRTTDRSNHSGTF